MVNINSHKTFRLSIVISLKFTVICQRFRESPLNIAIIHSRARSITCLQFNCNCKYFTIILCWKQNLCWKQKTTIHCKIWA